MMSLPPASILEAETEKQSLASLLFRSRVENSMPHSWCQHKDN